MAMDFPNSPVNGTTYTVGNTTWIYDGAKWNIQPTTIQGVIGQTGAQGIQGIQGIQGVQGLQGRQGIQGIDAASAISVIPAKTGTYVFTSGDEGDLISFNSASNLYAILPTNATTAFVQGTQINIMRLGTGGVWIQGPNTTVLSVQGTPGLQLRAQYSSATAIKMGTDHWIVVGDLTL